MRDERYPRRRRHARPASLGQVGVERRVTFLAVPEVGLRAYVDESGQATSTEVVYEFLAGERRGVVT